MAHPISAWLGKVNPRFYGLGMAGRMAWLAAGAAVAVALVLGAEVTGWTVWTFVPLIAPAGVRAKSRGSQRAPGLIALAMGLEATAIVSGGAYLYALFVAPILLLCFMATSAIASD